jgi:hypothetical protein
MLLQHWQQHLPYYHICVLGCSVMSGIGWLGFGVAQQGVTFVLQHGVGESIWHTCLSVCVGGLGFGWHTKVRVCKCSIGRNIWGYVCVLGCLVRLRQVDAGCLGSVF